MTTDVEVKEKQDYPLSVSLPLLGFTAFIIWMVFADDTDSKDKDLAKWERKMTSACSRHHRELGVDIPALGHKSMFTLNGKDAARIKTAYGDYRRCTFNSKGDIIEWN